MTEFGRKIRPGMPPETSAEKHYDALKNPDADEKFAAEFPLDKIPGMIEDNEAQEEMEAIESIRSQAKYRREYLAGALGIINQLFEGKTFRHKSTLDDMYGYFGLEALKLKDQALIGETRAKDTNTLFALRSLLELKESGYPPTLKYLKICKILSAKLKDIEITLQQPEL